MDSCSLCHHKAHGNWQCPETWCSCKILNPKPEQEIKKYPRKCGVVNAHLYRQRVPGGWLVYSNNASPWTFFPDPDHEWILEEETAP